MNWDLQANVSLRKSPQEQFKKLVRNKGQRAVGQAQQASGRLEILSFKTRIIPTCQSPRPTNNISPSIKKEAEEKMAHLNLSPSYVLQTVAP